MAKDKVEKDKAPKKKTATKKGAFLCARALSLEKMYFKRAQKDALLQNILDPTLLSS